MEQLQRVSDEMAQLVKTAQAGLVKVGARGNGVGSGFVVHPAGLILTNAHVVRTTRVPVRFADGRQMSAKVLARSRALDLALLWADVTDLSALELSPSVPLPGSVVLALGHPWGIEGAASAGIVIGTSVDEAGLEWVLVHLRLRPGNSGGPLVDSAGRVVGINSVMTGPESGAAISSRTARAFLKQALGGRLGATAA